MKKIYFFFAATLITVNSMALPLVLKRLGNKILNNQSIYNNQIITNNQIIKNSIPQALKFNHQIIQGNMLDGLDLRKSQFNKCTLLNVNLDHRDLEEAEFYDSDLRGTSLKGTNLTKASINGCDLTEAKLNEAKMQGVNLNWSNLTKTDLTKADLRTSILTGTNFFLAKLREANLEESNLTNTILIEADLSYSILKKAILKGIYFMPYKYTFKDFVFCAQLLLTGATSENVDNWLKSKFETTRFEGANLENAQLINSNLKKARLKNVNLRNTTWINSILEDTHFINCDLAGSDIHFLSKTNIPPFTSKLTGTSTSCSTNLDISFFNCKLAETKLENSYSPERPSLYDYADLKLFRLYYSDEISIEEKELLRQKLITQGTIGKNDEVPFY